MRLGSNSAQRPPTIMEMEEATVPGHEQSHHGAHQPHRDLNGLATSATIHCLTGCAIGEIVGMAIATALAWGNVGQIALAVGLAYVFGFSLTARPLIKAGLAAGTVVSTAFAADTVSITIMELIDNFVVVLIPGAMEAGVGDPLLYGAVALGFVVAFPFAWYANRYMLARGKGHAVVHEYH